MMRTLLALVGAGIGYFLVVPVILIALPFWIVALLTRALKPWIEPRSVPWNALMQFDPVVGWKPKPSTRAYCEAAGADVFYVETDEEGWCGSASFDDSPLVVFGDSYAFGYAVNRPFFRVANSGLRTKSIGAPGYNMVQELILMTQFAPRLRGKLVVWFIYSGNDLTDNLSPAMQGYRSPFLRRSDDRGGWEIFTKHLQPDKWSVQPRFDRNKKISAVFGRNQTSERVYGACEFLIGRGQAVCREAGANLVVLMIPWPVQFDLLPRRGVNAKTLEPDLPESKIGEICKRLGVEFVPGREHELANRQYLLSEGHLNDKGHRRLTEILHDLYQKHRSFVPNETWHRSVPIKKAASQAAPSSGRYANL